MNDYIEDLMNDIKEMESFDVEENLIRVRKKIGRSSSSRRWRVFASAAAFAAVFAVLALFVHDKTETVEMMTAYAPAGQVLTVTLPDSSLVFLNSGTTLRFPEKFAKDKREVYLDGQGWFSVHASKSYPFYVNTSKGLSLYVYGTEFDVAAYPHEKNIEIYLAKGNMNMMLPEKNVECTLKPTQKLTYDTVNESIDMENMPDGMGYEWRQGNLGFRSSRMDEILMSLSRRFDLEIDAVNASGDTNKYYASFTASETLEEILTQLSGLTDLTWHNVGTDAEGRKHMTVKY